VFLCLAALYESWSIPFSVILVVPLGVFGTLLMRSARAQTLLNRVAGLVFLGLAVRLATAQRN